MDLNQIKEYNEQFENSTAAEVLDFFLKNYKEKITFSSSLGAEDQMITQMIVAIDPTANIFTLDTGRLFPEAYELIEKTNSRYHIKMQTYFPASKQVERMVNEKGVNLFYESIENRKLCCNIRKIKPLLRALEGYDIWITGLRKDQSVTRNNNQLVEYDEHNKIVKLNPLINWSEKEVWDYIHANNIPYNPLHDQGFLSIGCQPCTRAVEDGEDVRAGRWWWELPEHKECGLHQK